MANASLDAELIKSKVYQESVKQQRDGKEKPAAGKVIIRLAAAILDTDHFAQDAGGRLYVYRDGHYGPHGVRYVLARVKALLASWNESDKWSSYKGSEVVEYLRVDAPFLWERPPVERINLLNGLLDLATGELRPHSPQWLSSIQIPLTYDPHATCPAWDQFVNETFPEGARALAYELAADLLTPDRSEQVAILLTGEGGNGKSAFLAALTAVVGRHNIASLSLQKIEADKFAAARLVGKLANICPDLPSTHLTGTSVFKAITGGDTITAERKYSDSFDFTPSARLLFSANRPPHSGDDSEAFFQR